MSCPCLGFEEATGSIFWLDMPGNRHFGGTWCMAGVQQSCWERVDD